MTDQENTENLVMVLCLRVENLLQRIEVLEDSVGANDPSPPPLSIEEFASTLVTFDFDKQCRLGCGKNEWGEWGEGGGDHKHKEGCPFALAYQILTIEVTND